MQDVGSVSTQAAGQSFSHETAPCIRGLAQSRVHQNPAAYNTEIPVRDAFVNLRTLPMS